MFIQNNKWKRIFISDFCPRTRSLSESPNRAFIHALREGMNTRQGVERSNEEFFSRGRGTCRERRASASLIVSSPPSRIVLDRDLVFRGLRKPAILFAVLRSPFFLFQPITLLLLLPLLSLSFSRRYTTFSFHSLTPRSNLKRCIVASPFSLYALTAPE